MKKRWIPEVGELYWFVGAKELPRGNWDLLVVDYTYRSPINPNDKEYKINCFRTREEARKAVKKIRGILKGKI